MPVYCCFCLTADNHIIGGAHIDAANVGAAFEMAGERWRHVPRLNFIEVWAVGELLRRAAVTPPRPPRRKQLRPSNTDDPPNG
jgi:hypothetical protein